MLGKMLNKLSTIIIIAIIVWFVFSWGEVIANNLDPNPTYSSINLFTLLLGGAQ